MSAWSVNHDDVAGNKPTIKPKMEYASDFKSIGTDLQKAVNMDECHKYPATIEEKDCHSGLFVFKYVLSIVMADIFDWMIFCPNIQVISLGLECNNQHP